MSGLLLVALPGSEIMAEAGSGHLSSFQKSAPEPAELLEANELSRAALKLYNEGKFKEALSPAKRALEIREKTLPPEDKRVDDALGNLAVIHLALNNFKEAEGLYKRILASAQKASSVEGLPTANALDALAWVHYARGDRRRAETDLKQALAIREKIAGPDSETVARTLYKLAQLYQFHDELKKAEQLYQRIIASDKNVLPESSPILIESVDAYACLLRKLKRPEEARELEDRIEGRILRVRRPPPVDVGILNGKALKLPKPAYPAAARQQRVSGVVVVRVRITEAGKVTHACAESGDRLFWQACESVAYGAEFEPTMVNGKAVRVTGVITYNFIAK